MIAYLANKTAFREKPHRTRAQTSRLFLQNEKPTGTLKKLSISNLFVGSGAFTAIFDQLRKFATSGHRDGETVTNLAA